MTQTGDSSHPSSFILHPSIDVMLDDPHPAGSTGLTSAILVLHYDPAVLGLTAGDIALGSIPGLGSGWKLYSAIDQASGTVVIELVGLAPLTDTDAGSLVTMNFHVLPGATSSTTSITLLNSARLGEQSYSTTLADDLGGWILSPGIDRVLLPLQ